MVNMSISVNFNYSKPYSADSLKAEAIKASELLKSHGGKGSDYLGWIDLPVNYDKEEFERIKTAAEKIKNDSDVLLVLGIGGSYLGARAAIDLLKSPLYNNMKKDTMTYGKR